jgi:hypothetical protein
MSYGTIAAGDTYFASRLGNAADAWTAATDPNKTKAIAHGTSIIDQLNFKGEMADDDQDNQFPRGDDSEVPTAIEEATYDIAGSLLDGADPEVEGENLRLKAQGYGNIRSTYDTDIPAMHHVAGVPSRTAWLKILPFLRDVSHIHVSRA